MSAPEVSETPPNVSWVRQNEMRDGEQYEMQRGPTRRPRRVTLLAKEAPSGRSHLVLVRVEEGVGQGNEIEAPSRSLYPLPGREPAPAPKRRKRQAQPEPEEAPPGWVPKPGEGVTWTQTLGLRLTVVDVDDVSGVARVEGKEVFGVREVFEAPIVQLRPYRTKIEVVFDKEVEERLGNRLPPRVGIQGERLKAKPPRIKAAEEYEDIVQRLIFDPKLLNFYRQRFAKRSTVAQAEVQLREELRTAKPIRKRHTGEYLRLRVLGRFDVVLDHRPIQGEVASCYVKRLQLPARARRRRKAA